MSVQMIIHSKKGLSWCKGDGHARNIGMGLRWLGGPSNGLIIT
jgi:hypothetical protein